MKVTAAPEDGPHALPLQPHPGHLDFRQLRGAWRTVRGAAEWLGRVAGEEGWPRPFPPIRYRVLAQLREATAFGLTPARLARLLAVRPSTLAYHLDELEAAEMISRSPRRLADMRSVSVRLTDRGTYVLHRCASAF